VNCGLPSNPGPNGEVVASLTTFNSVANYSCNSGYVLILITLDPDPNPNGPFVCVSIACVSEHLCAASLQA